MGGSNKDSASPSAEFDKELFGILSEKLPISSSRISSLTKLALHKYGKYYKNVVYAIEKFLSKSPPEYKLPGLYVIDSIARAAQKAGSTEGDAYLARFEEKMKNMLVNLKQAPPKDLERMKKVLNLWRKGEFFTSDVITLIESSFLPSTGDNSQNGNGRRDSADTIDSNSYSNYNDASSSTIATNTSSNTDHSKLLQTLQTLTSNLPSGTSIPSLAPAKPVAEPVVAPSATNGNSNGNTTNNLDWLKYLGANNNNNSSTNTSVTSVSSSLPPQNALAAFLQQQQQQQQSKPQQSQSQSQQGQRIPVASFDSDSPPPAEISALLGLQNILNKVQQQSPAPVQQQLQPLPPQQHQHSPIPAKRIPSTQYEPDNQNMSSTSSSTTSVISHGDKQPVYDPTVPATHIKVLTRTLYVGNIAPHLTQLDVATFFSRFGEVDTVILNTNKNNAFVKLTTRASAERARKAHRGMIQDVQINVNWASGFGNKELFDRGPGWSLLPLASLTDTEKRWLASSKYGGGPPVGGTVMEEPDTVDNKNPQAGIDFKSLALKVANDMRQNPQQYQQQQQQQQQQYPQQRRSFNADQQRDYHRGAPSPTSAMPPRPVTPPTGIAPTMNRWEMAKQRQQQQQHQPPVQHQPPQQPIPTTTSSQQQPTQQEIDYQKYYESYYADYYAQMAANPSQAQSQPPQPVTGAYQYNAPPAVPVDSYGQYYQQQQLDKKRGYDDDQDQGYGKRTKNV